MRKHLSKKHIVAIIITLVVFTALAITYSLTRQDNTLEQESGVVDESQILGDDYQTTESGQIYKNEDPEIPGSE